MSGCVLELTDSLLMLRKFHTKVNLQNSYNLLIMQICTSKWKNAQDDPADIIQKKFNSCQIINKCFN